MNSDRIEALIAKARRRDLLAAIAVALVAASAGVAVLWVAQDLFGRVFGFLFLFVALLGPVAIYRLDAGRLTGLHARIAHHPDSVVWLHFNTIPNRLRRGECLVLVFANDRTHARVALPRNEARELFELLSARAHRARVTEELPLPELLELEKRWRQHPDSLLKS